ncbi:unnamed protein product [Effrenium voratum]|nr:unnamed protein product [Effrenium voratum]
MTVLEFYKDWWVSQSGMLAIAEDSRVEELNRCISRMFELGVPLALGEKRTPQFTLFQEIEIRGNKTECITAEELVGEGSPFLAVLAKSLAELYPQLTLDLFVLDGSGASVQLGVQQTYLRLVWQNVIVDLARAQFILDLLVLGSQSQVLARPAPKG